MKTCKTCSESKPVTEFHRDSGTSDGLRPRCKTCVKIYDDVRKEKRNARAREIYSNDPASKILKTRQYHLDNPEWSKERLRASHERNMDVRRERVNSRKLSDPEFLMYRRNLTRMSELKRRAQKKGTSIDPITLKDLNNLLVEHGNICWICEKELDASFHWDHVKPLSKGGTHTLDNLKPACASCNVRKSNTWPFTKVGR